MVKMGDNGKSYVTVSVSRSTRQELRDIINDLRKEYPHLCIRYEEIISFMIDIIKKYDIEPVKSSIDGDIDEEKRKATIGPE